VRHLVAHDGIAVLGATHLVDEVDPQDHIVVLHRGQLLAQGLASRVIDTCGVTSVRDAFIQLTRSEDLIGETV
jgi:ABC-2 type transport system ATP-binding protein